MESRSTFVTVLAWIFIIGSGFASFVSVIQVIMVSNMFSGEVLRSMPDNAPAIATFMSQYFHLFVYGFCAVAIFTFISSVALLKRNNWARLAFIWILSIGILWQVGMLSMQFTVFLEFPATQGARGFEGFESMRDIIRGFSFTLAIVVSALFIWIIKRLLTQPIVGEFILNTSNNTDDDYTNAGA